MNNEENFRGLSGLLIIESGFKNKDTLRCVCGSDYTHHETVDIYVRDEEDSDKGVHVEYAEEAVKIDSDLGYNPSKRRDGIQISLSCEQCDRLMLLNIAQHKGQTLIWIEDCGV